MDTAPLHPGMMGRIALATVLGAAIGYERARAGKAAGVRTHGMVALGAALFTAVSVSGFGERGDPARVAAQIVTGVGFLGAGTILHLRASVQGLTTAASLWVTAAIGMAVSVGMYLMSIETAALVWVLLRLGRRLNGDE